jgi:carbonic anhydrase
MNAQSPDNALERLRQGNERFRTDRTEGPGRDAVRRAEVAGGQRPYAVILGCADSRVPPEILFDAGLGDLFVVRVAGNLANTASVASIEYALAHLGTRLVVVLGHGSCGAVTAAYADGADDESECLHSLLDQIRPAIADLDDPAVDAAAHHNAECVAAHLVERSEIIRNAVEHEGARIVIAFYDLETGAVAFD